MSVTKLCFALLLCDVAILLAQADLGSEFDHTAWLDPNENYKLYWTINRAEKSIHIAVEVKTTGWIGLGISKGLTGKMENADIVIGWVDASGKAHLTDCHGTGNTRPVIDAKQDYELQGLSSQSSTKTVLKFKRKLKTCDKDDNDIDTVTTKLIFAWGSADPAGNANSGLLYHGGSQRGSRSLNLLNYVKNSPTPQGAKYFDLMQRQIMVPAQKTIYWCTPYRLSDIVKLNSTKHIIEIAPVIQPRLEGLVHHMVLYACKDKFNPAHLNITGQCYHRSMPRSIRECAGVSAIYAWAIGGVNFKFPVNVGLPIGGWDSVKYVLLETHFDNPLKRNDFNDTSGLRFYYSEPRKYEAATLTTGQTVTPNLLIPPNMDGWVVEGICTKACSERIRGSQALSDDTINIFATFPHAHTAGHAIWTTLVRNGTAQREIIRDDNYDFNYQQTHLLPTPIPFRAGDELFTYCKYRTKSRQYASIGGLGTNDEMCLNFIMYYPKVNFTVCSTIDGLERSHFSDKYKKGKWMPGYNQSDPQTWPKSWDGVAWNATMVTELKKLLNYTGPNAVYDVCRGTQGFSYKQGTVAQRPMIRKKLPPPKNECVKTHPSSAARVLPIITLLAGSFLIAVITMAHTIFV